MKTTSATNLKSLLANFDVQLLSVLKDDLRQQKQKMKAKFVHMATRSYDSELLAIMKADISKIKDAMNNSQNSLAQAV